MCNSRQNYTPCTDHPSRMGRPLQLTKTCFWAYNATATGLGPETMTFYNHMDYQRFSRKKAAGASLLRAESL